MSGPVEETEGRTPDGPPAVPPAVPAPRIAVPTPAAPDSGAFSTRTIRQLLTTGVVVALVVLAVLAVAGGIFLNRAGSIGDQLLNRDTPAIVASTQLENALVDQETGVRGYGLSGQHDFLEPYTQGWTQQQTAVRRLHQLLPADSDAGRDLVTALDRVKRWQDDFARPIVAARPVDVVPLSKARADRGKSEFDAVRGALAAEQEQLRGEEARAMSDRSAIDTERTAVFAAIAAVLLALAVLVFVALRRGVTGPLEQLSQDVRRVARGDFAHPVRGSGPADLYRLARDVDRMRERLSAELEFSNQARDRLDEQATDLRRSNAELEQFAYVASHDLQEPLRKVASFCQLLERRYAEQLDDRARQYIGFAVDGANRMQGLINDLLEFSRVGRLHTDHGPVDLDALLTRTEDSLSVVLEESGAQLRHDPLPTVHGDATQLGMMLQNLVSNAVKFRSPDRPPRIDVTVERRGALWEIAVADNGIGIEATYAEKVFVIFQRLHTRETYPGNGIGLALCKKIVEYHGGTIALDPGHGPGARIVLTLPVADGDLPDEGLPDADSAAAGGRG